jgi:hypothetical protein
MILRLGQDPRDHSALFGNPEPAFGAEGFDVDRLLHEMIYPE